MLLPDANCERDLRLRSSEDSPAAVQGHCDLVSVHLKQLHLDIMDAGGVSFNSCSQNTISN